MTELLDMPRLSLAERDRRWAKVRAAMAGRDLACIITAPHTGHWEQFAADTRYLTHIGGNNSETACVFPREGEVTAIVLNRPDFWLGVQNWVTDLRTPKQAKWSIPVIERMKELGITNQRVGVAGLGDEPGIFAGEGYFPHHMFEAIRGAFPDAIYEDVTAMMAQVRAVKSPEEVDCMAKSIEIIETGLKKVAETARPGVSDHTVFTALYSTMMEAGSEIPTMLIWGTAPGRFSDAFLPTYRKLQKGDWISDEIQSRYLGYGAQRVQPGVLGEPPAALVKSMDQHRTLFNAVVQQLKAGTETGQVFSTAEEVAGELGCHYNLVLQGRGIGEDRPNINSNALNPRNSAIVLQEGHVFCIKAHVDPREGPGIIWADTVAVTPTGGRRLGKDPHDLLVIPC
jgi:Xaa-Pro aminopeptidase